MAVTLAADVACNVRFGLRLTSLYSLRRKCPPRSVDLRGLAMAEAMMNLRGQAGRALAFETIELMAAHDVPVTAANYEVWLAHKIGSRPDLSREIDARIGRGEGFNDEVNDDFGALLRQHAVVRADGGN
jgi:hypothetical protein